MTIHLAAPRKGRFFTRAIPISDSGSDHELDFSDCILFFLNTFSRAERNLKKRSIFMADEKLAYT